MRISDWSADVCSSDLGSEGDAARRLDRRDRFVQAERGDQIGPLARRHDDDHRAPSVAGREVAPEQAIDDIAKPWAVLTALQDLRSEARRVGNGGVGTWRHRGAPYQ